MLPTAIELRTCLNLYGVTGTYGAAAQNEEISIVRSMSGTTARSIITKTTQFLFNYK